MRGIVGGWERRRPRDEGGSTVWATPALPRRWAFLGCIALIYTVRVALLDGFFVVTYALGILHINLLVGFLTPKWLPREAQDAIAAEADEGTGPALPRTGGDALRLGDNPVFVRRLPEFRFWWTSLRAWVAGLAATFIPPLDVPVFWPLLLAYFLLLLAVTCKQQLDLMRRHGYVPWESAKPKS